MVSGASDVWSSPNFCGVWLVLGFFVGFVSVVVVFVCGVVVVGVIVEMSVGWAVSVILVCLGNGLTTVLTILTTKTAS